MARACLKNTTIAESPKVEAVEGNTYFPQDAIVEKYFEASDHHTVCGWKGEANYFHLVVDGVRHDNAAWYYPDPKPEAAHIKNHVAFYPVVDIME